MLYSASLGLANRVNTRLPPTNKFSERNHERDFVSVFVQAGERYAVPRDVSLRRLLHTVRAPIQWNNESIIITALKVFPIR